MTWLKFVLPASAMLIARQYSSALKAPELQLLSDRRRSDGGVQFPDDTSDLLLSPTADLDWLVVDNRLAPASERDIEALFAVGYGYLGMVPSIVESARFSHSPTYVA